MKSSHMGFKGLDFFKESDGAEKQREAKDARNDKDERDHGIVKI